MNSAEDTKYSQLTFSELEQQERRKRNMEPVKKNRQFIAGILG